MPSREPKMDALFCAVRHIFTWPLRADLVQAVGLDARMRTNEPLLAVMVRAGDARRLVSIHGRRVPPVACVILVHKTG
jgi:hypothetical protein